MLDTARRVSVNDFPIIIEGESGTEKELLLVSFGTSYLDTLEKTLGEIYRYMEEQFPDYVVGGCFYKPDDH